MFASRLFNLADEAIERLEDGKVLGRRLNSRGSQMWGEKNKLAIHLPSKIPVDLFRTDEENWWNYLVCRTGPASLNETICIRAKEMGWKWKPYGAGFSKDDGADSSVCKSERAVFEFVNLPYREPKDRL